MNTPNQAGRSKQAKAAKQLTAVELFFYTNAGYSYGKGESPEAGRIRCARELAQAEQYAANLEWEYEWEWDDAGCNGCDCGSSDCDCSSGADHETLVCLLKDADGNVLESLGGICGATSEYRRVVEAELASQALVTFDREIDVQDAH